MQSTTNYDKFKLPHNNRDIMDNRVKALVTAIAKKNLLPYKPILVNTAMEVLDGQHRLKAAETLGLPIYYSVMPDESGRPVTLRSAIATNVNQWRWTPKDYLKMYTEDGLEDYIILKNFCEHHKISPNLGVKLLSGIKPTSTGATHGQKKESTSSRILHAFYDGRFKIAPGALKAAEDILGRLDELTEYSTFNVKADYTFVGALKETLPKIRFKRLTEKLRIHGLKLQKQRRDREYKIQFDDIYNYRAKDVVRLY